MATKRGAHMPGPEGVVARYQHSNESLHRHHNISAETCDYCELVGLYAIQALVKADYLVVPRGALTSVMDSLAEHANERGELHEGLTELLRTLGIEV